MSSIETLRPASARLRVLGALLFCGFVLLGARAVQLALFEERGAKLGRAQTDKVQTFAAPRGVIFDRSGAELAVTVHAPSVFATPAKIQDLDATARSLAPLLGHDAARLRKRLDTRSRFVFLQRWTDAQTAQAVRARALPGIGVLLEPRRSYPLGALAGPVVGFANIDGVGVRGAEQAEDAWLRGGTQRARHERDARGRLLAPAGFDLRAGAGGDVALHLDAALQAEMESALEGVVRRSGARGGLAVALEAESGALLGAAETPGMDPNTFRTLPYARTRSRVFLDAFEPGSVLKPLVIAAALELGALRADELIDCEQGRYRVPGKTLRDLKPNGLLDPAGLLRVSSNIGVVKIAHRLAPRAHFAALGAFGLGRSTGSGFPDESAGLLRAPEHWQPLDQATVAFGQGVNVTAVQLAAALAVFASEGEWRAPQLVRARRAPGGAWQPVPAPEARRVLRRKTARELRAMLESVTAPGGTGRRAALAGVSIAGKTGTAQKFDAARGRYSDERFRAWFAGIAPVPASARRAASNIVVVTMVDEPRGLARGGGDVAAPLFARIASAALAREDVWARPLFELARNAEYSEEADAQFAQRAASDAHAAHDADAQRDTASNAVAHSEIARSGAARDVVAHNESARRNVARDDFARSTNAALNARATHNANSRRGALDDNFARGAGARRSAGQTASAHHTAATMGGARALRTRATGAARGDGVRAARAGAADDAGEARATRDPLDSIDWLRGALARPPQTARHAAPAAGEPRVVRATGD